MALVDTILFTTAWKTKTMKTNSNRLVIALQKKGRLNSTSIDLLKHCGVNIRVTDNSLIAKCKDLPIDILFVRDDDIPTLVMDGICDLGIIGENVLLEKHLDDKSKTDNFETVKKMGFSRCRLSIAVEKNKAETTTSLDGLKIATSYPNLLQQYLEQNNINAKVLFLSGSVEIAPSLEMADAICDLVSTGRTLEENGLTEIEKIMESQAVLIKSTNRLTAEKKDVFDLLLRRINGVIQARETKYIMLHAPQSKVSTITDLLPGSEVPTIISLGEKADKVAVHSVCSEGVFWGTLEKLKAAGASSILVLPIEKILT